MTEAIVRGEQAADRGRTAVYAAEVMAFEGTDLETIVAIDELRSVARDVTSQSWWERGHVDVCSTRAGATSSSARSGAGGDHLVSIAGPQCTRATLMHELAHVLAGIADGHGPTFRRAHVDLATAIAGSERSQWLAAAYRSAGLSLGHRIWVKPPPADAPIAL